MNKLKQITKAIYVTALYLVGAYAAIVVIFMACAVVETIPDYISYYTTSRVADSPAAH